MTTAPWAMTTTPWETESATVFIHTTRSHALRCTQLAGRTVARRREISADASPSQSATIGTRTVRLLQREFSIPVGRGVSLQCLYVLWGRYACLGLILMDFRLDDLR